MEWREQDEGTKSKKRKSAKRTRGGECSKAVSRVAGALERQLNRKTRGERCKMERDGAGEKENGDVWDETIERTPQGDEET